MLNKISLSNLPLIPLISLITFTIIGLIYSLKFIKNQLFPNKKLKKQIINPPSDSILSLMKNTPLLYIKSLSKITGYNIYAKLENYLPFTSKDRMIKNIILTAEKNGKLNKDSIIYEGSSGNTGYSVAIISKILGYKCTIIIPYDCSNKKINLLKTTGCKIIITKQYPFSNFKDNYIRLTKK
jgi:cysteine synthase A